MRKIRYNTFETNSSSTHAIVVSKKMERNDYDSFSWDRNYSFGREESRLVYEIDEKIAYIWAILKNIYGEYHWDESMGLDGGYYTYNNEKLKEFESITKNICKTMIPKDMSEINELFKLLKDNIDSYEISVDHCEYFREDGKCREFIDKIYKDADFYKRLLFSKDSYITVGGDEYRGYNIKTIGFQYDYDEDYINEGTKNNPKYKDIGEFWDKLEKYKETHDVYLKGN